MIVDFSAHVMPPEAEVRARALRFTYFPSTLEDRLRVMDKYGVCAQVIHLSAANLSGMRSGEASAICRAANNYIFEEFMSKRPDRFIGCGILNLLDVDFSLEELDRIVGMGFRCVTVATHQESVELDHSSLRPLFERIVKYGLPVFIHPVSWERNPPLDAGPMYALGWPFDTSVALWKLIVGGVLDEFPELKVVTHHLGGMFPYYRMRIEVRLSRHASERLKRPLTSYMQQVYADTAVDGGSVADLMVAYSLFGSGRLLFGSDWPYIEDQYSIGENITAIRSMPIPDEEKSRILYLNALELLKIKEL